MKRCITCNKLLVIGENWLSSYKKDRWYKCTSCVYQEKIKLNRKLIHSLKEHGCAICGYNKCLDALDFHHVNPENKEFPLNARTIDFTRERIIIEFYKCMLLCKNCHAEIHANNKEI